MRLTANIARLAGSVSSSRSLKAISDSNKQLRIDATRGISTYAIKAVQHHKQHHGPGLAICHAPVKTSKRGG
jgi:hypothetical protein